MNPTQQRQPQPAPIGQTDPTVLPAGLPRAEEQRLAPPLTPAGPGLAPPQPSYSNQVAAPQPAPAAQPTAAKAAVGQPKEQPKAEPHPNSTQNSLQIAEIRDGIVILNDGSFRA